MKQNNNSRSPAVSVLSTFLAILLLITSVPFFVSAASFFTLGTTGDQTVPDFSTVPDPTTPLPEEGTLGLSVANPDMLRAAVTIPAVKPYI